MSSNDERFISDLAQHAVERIETVLATIFPLLDNPKQREELAMRIASHIVGFTAAAVQNADHCSYPQAVQKVAEQLVEALLSIKDKAAAIRAAK